MALELEFKFTLNGEVPDLPELAALLRPAGFEVEERPLREQHDRYLDSVTGILARSGLALRLRTVGERRLVTLKSGGSGEDGLHAREELELPFTGSWPAEVRERLRGVANPDTLEPTVDLFTERRRVAVTRGGTALAEFSFDEVRAERPGGRSEARTSVHFREVELEAVTADRSTLTRIAAALREGLALFPNTVNKLERAQALLLMAEEITGSG